MKRFIGGVYGKLNSSFRSLRDSINTFTDEVYENYLAATVSQINLTVRSYFRFWLETAILKNIGGAFHSAAYMFYNTIIVGIIWSNFSYYFRNYFIDIKLIGAEMQPHYNLLSSAETIGSCTSRWCCRLCTDKEYSIFYGKEYETNTILEEDGTPKTTVQQLGEANSDGNISGIEDITKASIYDLYKMWSKYKNEKIWRKAIETNREIIREMRGISKEDWDAAEDQGKRYDNTLDWPESIGGDGVIYIEKKTNNY